MTRSQRQDEHHAGAPNRSRERAAGPTTASLEDSECVLLARDGDARGLTELVRRYSAHVFALLARVLRDRHLAEDATQEVFLRAHRAISRFDATRSFRSWLYTIAWNHARDLLRRRAAPTPDGRLACRLGDRDGDGDGDGHRSELSHADPRARPPEEALELRERQRWVRDALDALGDAERAILLLRDFEGLSYDELAQVLDWPLGTVKSRIHRARLELKATLLRLDPGFAPAVRTTDASGDPNHGL